VKLWRDKELRAGCLQSLSRLLLTKDSIMALNFEWDANKAKSNSGKHGISFEEAATIFGDSSSLTIPDPVHSELEERFITLGSSHRGKLLVVVHTERGDKYPHYQRASREQTRTTQL